MITFEPHQERAIALLATKRRALVKSPAGSGKTLIAAGALAKVIGLKPRTEPVRIGWVSNTEDQCNQAQAAIDAIPELAGADVKIRCAASQTDWSDRQVLIVDEAHNALRQTWSAQIATCKGAVWAFSATPDTADMSKDEIAKLMVMFGNEMITITRQEVGHRLVPARVILLDAFDDGLGPQIDEMIEARMKRDRRFSRLPEFKLLQRISWDVIRKHGIEKNQARNAAAIELAKHHAENHVLILVNTIKHGMDLQKRIPGSRFCSASGGKALRHKLIEEFKAGKLHCLIATSLADEGLDVPVADVGILLSGGQSNTKSEQRSGRVLRKFPGKEYAIWYDFRDSSCRLMAKHSERRQAVYRQLNYEMSGELELNFV